MSFSFKFLFHGSAPTSALNLMKFLVPWDSLSGGRNNLLYQLNTVFIYFFFIGWAWWTAWWLGSPLQPTSICSSVSLTSMQAAVVQDGDFVALLLFEPNHGTKENTTSLSIVSNDNAQLLRWEIPSLKLHRILKPVLAKRRVGGKNQYWTVLKCLCSTAVLSGFYRAFRSCCQQMEEIQLLKSQRIINSVFDLQLCTVYKKSIVCHMLLPYA